MPKPLLMVEDGSVCIEELEEKVGNDYTIVVYRAGATMPMVEPTLTRAQNQCQFSANARPATAKDRLAEERKQLDDRMVSLNTFIDSKKFTEMSEESRDLLTWQYHVMSTYHDILCIRIKNWIEI